MQIAFTQKELSCLQQLKGEYRRREVTQELRLTEDLPDIGQVLGVWGQPLIRGKQWRTGCGEVSGGVMAFVLYEPEEGGQPRCLQAWMPFSETWDLPDSSADGKILACCSLTGMDARPASARKLVLRAGLGIRGEFLTPDSRTVAVPPELPEDVQVLRRTYPVQLPGEAGEKAFTLDESQDMPVPALGRVVRMCMEPEIADRKVMGDKLVFRGTGTVHVLYQGEDGKLCPWDFQVPFSQYAQLEQEYEEGTWAQVVPQLTALELEPEGQQVRLKAGITCQYVIYRRELLELCQDAYSNLREVQARTETLELPGVLDRHRQKLTARLPFSGAGCLDGAFYLQEPETVRDPDRVRIHLSGTAELLSRDPQGQLQRESLRWEDGRTLAADEQGDLQVRAFPAGMPGTAGTELQQELMLELDTLDTRGMVQITQLELGEMLTPAADRPSLVIRTAGERTLWELARDCGSTVSAICSANGLEGEPEENRLLLIPVM